MNPPSQTTRPPSGPNVAGDETEPHAGSERRRRPWRALRERATLLLVVGFVPGTALLLQQRYSVTLAVYGLAVLTVGAIAYRLRQATATLREAQAQTQAILDVAADGILTVDQDGRVHSFNLAASRLFGRPADAVI